MPDVFSKAKRSAVMSAIRSRGNKDTEGALAGVFRAEGIVGWRRQLEIRGQKSEVRRKTDVRSQRSEIGKKTEGRGQKSEVSQKRFRVRPDFVFPKLRVAVFVDGCFWHGCPKHGSRPKGNGAFWRKKLAANKARDRRVNRELRKAGWRVLRVWEHELHRRNERRLARKIHRELTRIDAN